MAEVIEYRYSELDKIAERIFEFGIKYIFTVFDDENYLFTDYAFRNDMHAILTIENYSNEKLYIENCNCGYGGVGPGNTEELLVRLGIPREIASELCLHNGFQIEYGVDNQPILEKIQKSMPFDSRGYRNEKDCIVLEHDSMAVNLLSKQLYFVLPQGKVLKSLLSCLDSVEIEKMHFYIGNENGKYFSFDVPYNLAHRNRSNQNVMEGSYIYFESNPFDIICLIGNESPASMINALYYYISGKVMFSEKQMGNVLVQELEDRAMTGSKMKCFKISRLLKMLISCRGKSEEIYYTVDVKKDCRHA